MAQNSRRGTAPLHRPPRAGLSFHKILNSAWTRGFILILAAVVIYQSAWSAGYVWDDDNHLTENPCIVGPLGFKEIWTTKYADISPLTRSTFWLEHAVWGLNPLPYHVINVLLHGACAVTLWRLLLRLQVPGAWLGAALWEVNPLQVETVSWVSEMKNTESGLFFLLALIFFLRWLARREEKGATFELNLVLTLLFCTLSIASKTAAVVLPAVFCLGAWWQGCLWQRRNFALLVPAGLLAAAGCALSLWTQKISFATFDNAHWARTLPQRVAGAGDALWFYLGKILWPHPLMAVYPRWQIDGRSPLSYLPLVAALAVLALFWSTRKTWGRPWFLVWAYFIVVLLPVLGLVDQTIFRYSLVYNHFAYLAGIGPMALAGAGLARGAEMWAPAKSLPVRATACALLLGLLSVLSWTRSWVYADDETLWTVTLEQNPACWVGNYNLGNDFSRDGRADEALAQYEKALALYPDFPECLNNLSSLLLAQGDASAAGHALETALQIRPGYAEAHYNLGNIYVKQGKAAAGISQYRQALAADPDLSAARDGLAKALAQSGQPAEAETQFDLLLQQTPGDAHAHLDLGNFYFTEHRWNEAISQYRQALQIDPHYVGAHNNLGLALGASGDLPGAIGEFQAALQLDPENSDAASNLRQAEAAAPNPR